jgi:hypothetical protein
MVDMDGRLEISSTALKLTGLAWRNLTKSKEESSEIPYVDSILLLVIWRIHCAHLFF